MTEIIVTMHTLNKYGIPCTDVTDYDLPSGTKSGEADVLYMQKVNSSIILHTKMKSTAYTEPDVEDDPNPTNGMMEFLYCDFHDSQVDYYSLYSGKYLCTGTLPNVLVDNNDPYLNPMVNINTNYASMCLYPLNSESKTYKSYLRDSGGNYTLQSTIELDHWPFDEVFSSYITFFQYNNYYIEDNDPYYVAFTDSGGVQAEWEANGDMYLVHDSECFCPDFLVGNNIYFNCCEITQPYDEGVYYESEFEKWNSNNILPDQGVLFSRSYIDDEYYILSKIDLLKNDLSAFIEVRDIKNLGIPQYFDHMFASGVDPSHFDHYVGTINVFNKNTNGGGWEIKGRYINGTLYICLKNGDTQKWYDSEGHFLYDFNLPTGSYVSHRINGADYFYYIIENDSKCYLCKYDMNTGYKQEFLLDNPYGENYEVVNRQLLEGRYIFARVGSSSTCVFIDTQNPYKDMSNYINMEISVNIGYYIIPNFMEMEFGNGYNPYLLQLCNELRQKHGREKMQWSPSLTLVAQAHANWCAENGVVAHIGSGGKNPSQRSQEVGITYPISENVTTVFVSNDESEQLKAFTNWISSPHHLSNIMASANKLMCFAYATYPSNITEIQVDSGAWNPSTQSYTTDISTVEIPEGYRGKMKIYVQNFIGY